MARIRRLEELAAGLPIDEALGAFVEGCKRPGKQTLWLPSSMMEPLLEELGDLLTEPITADQAAAIRGAVEKKHKIDTVLDWLRNSTDPWTVYLDRCRRQEEEKRRLEEAESQQRKQRENQERAALHAEFAVVRGQPLAYIHGIDVLNAFYDAWARCEMPPGYIVPGSGMGDLVLDGLRDNFSKHFINGLRAMLPDDHRTQSISDRNLLRNNFNHIWEETPVLSRRPLALCIWWKYLLPNVNTKWNVKPGNAETFLDRIEFIMRRETAKQDSVRYHWLEDIEGPILGSVKRGLFRLRLEYGIEGKVNNPQRLERGQRLTVRYHITSPLAFDLPVWLGANLEQDGQYFYHTNEDAETTLRPGEHSYDRFLTISRDWQCGNYKLQAEVWYGFCSAPSRSIALSTMTEHHVQVIEELATPISTAIKSVFRRTTSTSSREERMPQKGQGDESLAFYKGGTMSGIEMPEVPDRFEESLIRDHLARIANTPVFGQYIAKLRSRFTSRNQSAIIDHYIELYRKGTELVHAKNRLQQAVDEGVIKGKQTEVELEKLDADKEEHITRKEETFYKRQNIGREPQQDLPQKSADEMKREQAEERNRQSIRYHIETRVGKNFNTLAELQRWRKDKRRAILDDESLTRDEREELLDQMDSDYETVKEQLATKRVTSIYDYDEDD
jgi:hypothetical protein